MLTGNRNFNLTSVEKKLDTSRKQVSNVSAEGLPGAFFFS